jgi:hypothetical protein
MIQKRSIGMAIVLGIITCGIYFIYWEFKIWDSLYRATNRPSSAGVDVLLGIVTCGIYMIYMMYKGGKMEAEAYAMYGLAEKDEAALYLILSIFGLGVVALAIMQNNINNELADAVNGAHGLPYDDPQRRNF